LDVTKLLRSFLATKHRKSIHTSVDKKQVYILKTAMQKRILNIGIVAHVDAGKTTLTEQLLFQSGAIKQPGSVDKGSTISDNLALEKQRGITIQNTCVGFDWFDTKINFIDTPGHIDFSAEVDRAMSVLDGVVLLISAVKGCRPIV
jgi:ribosomal protection tetracycline resistance protein